ncbi:glycosyltransferase [Roseateles terrae]|uniref:Glycosyltransferase involved in cell wall biosynthesis n=1 Tax=Roseateles terrae TaxID=431060 RepID=A0ABR6GST2_9BURK|nr:glycosyltransferase [Roseateles terrae]MBB3195173.1 glycosyltransferase involved in cell wall biosynthesis [Roseateles terrae]
MSDSSPMPRAVPRVTVVMPAFNESAEIMTASLDSIAAQTLQDFECLVIDESTKPEAAATCRALCERDARFRYIHPDTRIGLAASLNLGIAQARAPLIARFDSDDVCLPHRLERQVAYLDQHPDVDVLGGGLEIFSADRGVIAVREYPVDAETIERRFQTTTPIAHPTVMMRRAVLERAGAYDPSFRFAEDLDLWLRLLNLGARFANLPEVLVRYRQQSTRRNPQHWQFNLRARTKNFSTRQLPRRVLGLLAIATWRIVPASIQERVFHHLLLRKG